MVFLSSGTGNPNEEGARRNGHPNLHVLGARSTAIAAYGATESRAGRGNTIATRCVGCITKGLRTRNHPSSEGCRGTEPLLGEMAPISSVRRARHRPRTAKPSRDSS